MRERGGLCGGIKRGLKKARRDRRGAPPRGPEHGVAGRLRKAAILAPLAGLAWLPGGGPTAATAQSSGGERVYVANQTAASVSIIDVASGEVVRTIDMTELGFDANCRPHDTAVDPDGRHWYVSLIGGGHVLRFTAEGELVGRAPFETPGLLAVDPSTDLLYVGRSMMAVNPPQRIGAIAREDMSVEELDVFFPRPHALTVDAEGDRIFAASLVENRVAVVEGGSGDIELADVDGPPHTFVQFALSPDRRHLVATAQLTGKLLVFDANSPDLDLLTEVDVGTQPWHPVYSPDGSRVYFGAKDDDAIIEVETEGWTVTRRATGRGIVEPHGSAVTADGRYLFVSNRNEKGAYTPSREVENNAEVGTVVKIDTRTFEVVQIIEVGAYPAGISIGPAG